MSASERSPLLLLLMETIPLLTRRPGLVIRDGCSHINGYHAALIGLPHTGAVGNLDDIFKENLRWRNIALGKLW